MAVRTMMPSGIRRSVTMPGAHWMNTVAHYKVHSLMPSHRERMIVAAPPRKGLTMKTIYPTIRAATVAQRLSAPQARVARERRFRKPQAGGSKPSSGSISPILHGTTMGNLDMSQRALPTDVLRVSRVLQFHPLSPLRPSGLRLSPRDRGRQRHRDMYFLWRVHSAEASARPCPPDTAAVVRRLLGAGRPQ